MKNPTLFKHVLVVLLLFIGLQSIAQNFVPFNPRFNQDVKGDILLIGNNILGPDNNAFNNNGTYNHNVNMRYIDIDGDPSTFSSTSADLIIPNPACYQIVYAGLYWGAVAPGAAPLTNVKFKGPTGGYNDIVGTIIYDANGAAVSNSFPYACYADVTAIVAGLATNQGTYTVGNVSSAQGRTASFGNGTGYSAGWSLFIVYEDPTLPGKSITSFDGFSSINSSVNLNVPVSGFRTVPAPSPVRANFAFAALEGDKPISGDRLKINGTNLTAVDRSGNNFFNSSVTQLSGLPVNNRNPNSTNTLGFDTGILNVPNPSNSVIANNDTSAIIRLESSQDAYFPYFYAFAVEIIEPKIVLTKIVQDILGNDIGGANVTLGDQLNYVIGFQNTGNDDATQFTIKDVLPINVIFNYPADMGILPPGVTVQSYNPVTREIIFLIDDSVVEVNDPVLEIRFKVQVVPSCNMLSDACSNSIDNQAYATYKGNENPSYTITDDPSLNTNTGCLLVPKATNFLVGVDDCLYTGTEVLCGASVVLTAANGYSSYSWSTSPTGSPVIGTTQSITVSNLGTYYVRNTAVAPCLSINQEITVVPFGGVSTNPVIPYADEVVICPNDGKQLPNIFLCGANDSREIQTGISDGSTIIWEKLNEASCAAVFNSDCANENPSCTWTQVGTGPDYTVNTSGQFRLTLNYAGGCFNRFYFNSYQNLLNPTVTTQDIICTTPGQITVGGVPAGYEYSLDNVTFQASNIFVINTQNIYTVYIKQVGVTSNPCIFSVPDIQIRERNFTVSTIVTAPLCNGGKGSVKLAANDVRPQYSYSIYDGATLINSAGPIAQSDYTFANLNPGTYTTIVTTEDGCSYTGTATIIDPPLLTATSAITKPLTCTDGEITVYPTGGTAPYFYFVNSTTVFQDFPEIVVTTPGVYDITVVDSNNCSTTTSITVNATPPPVFTIAKTDILCSGSGPTGTININVTNANGNSLLYSIDNGATFVNSPSFTGLAAGNYDVVVQYTTGPDSCTSVPQTITIATLPAITGTATLTTPYTCVTNGTITVSGVSGGTSPYSYSINGVAFQPGLTFSGLTSGTYTVTIRDANGCTFNTNAITIPPLNPPTDLTFSSSALTCPTNTSTVTITGTTGGFGALQYQIIAPAGSATAYQSSNIFSGLAPNTYTFQVKDANDCIYNESYTITPLPALTVVGQLINDVTCFGDSNGAVRYTVSGTSGFTYTINGGASIAGTSPINLSGLAAGSYTILITDSTTNCQATTSVTVNQPVAALSVTTTANPMTCIANGSVVINAAGGWGGYSYTLTQPDATILPPQGSNTFNNLTQAGTYIATVTDANGCIATSSFVLNVAVAPTASISPASNFCYDGVTGASLVVTASGGQTPYEYNINGGPFQASNTFANLIPGNYTIIVRDAYGCEVTLPIQTIAPQLTINTVLTKELDCTASPDAVITGTINGGYAPFTYEVSINSGPYSSLGATGTPFTYSTGTAGTYQFRITDARSCQAVSNVITINPITNPTVTATTTDVTCNGASDGTAQLVGSGGSGGYTFSNDNATFTATSLFTGLSNGSHTFYIKDSKNCSSSVVVNISQPTPLVATAGATAFSCSATNTKESAVITIAVPTTGTTPYQYSFNGGTTFSNSNTLTVNDNGANQTFTYVVRDANGCLTVAQDITLTALNPPTDLAFASSAVTCTATTSQVDLTATNGVGPLQYETIAPSPIIRAKQPSNSFTNLTPGTYVFQVTDANGCYYSESYTIVPVTPIAVTGTKLSDVLCFGDNSGAIQFTVSGYSGTYTSTLTSGAGTLVQSGNTVDLTLLVAGTYTLEVTDTTTGCVANATIIITEPANALTLVEASNVNANCFARAQVTVTASGGTPSYTYAFVQDTVIPVAGDYTSSASAVLDPATNTNWDVWVMDNQGCTFKLDVVIATDAVPTIDDVALQCYTGTPITITLSGTTVGAPSYSIGGAYQASPAFSINAPGVYNVSIKDGNGCIASKSFELKPELLLDANMTQDLTCAVDASITLTPSGGTGTYSTYEVDYNSGGYSVIAGSPYTATLDGNYQFRVTDDQGCQAESNIIVVTPKTTPTLTYTQTNVSCNGASDGSIVVTAANGIAPYQYSINGGPFIASNVFNGLPAGGYNVVVRDSKNCPSLATVVTITEPTVLSTTASVTTPLSCSITNTNQSAEITIAVPSTGTAPYQYSFDGGANFSSANTLTVNDNGTDQTFSYAVKDANGCTFNDTVTVYKLNPPLADTITSTNVTCDTPTSTVTVTPTVGTGVGLLTYEILSPIASATSNTTGIFSGLLPDTYLFKVTDVNGCYYEASHVVNPVTNITVSGALISDVTCNSASNGAVDFTVSNFSGTYSYTINGAPAVTGQSASRINLTLLPAVNQTIVVTDETTGCTDTVTVTVSEPTALTLGLLTNINANCNVPAQVSVTAGGGTPGYTYAFVQNGVPPVASDYTSSASVALDPTTNTDWDVWVMDANGCTTKLDVVIATDPVPTVTAAVDNQCTVTSGFTITATGSSGIPPYQYSINGGASYQSSPTFTVNTPGSYTVTIKDKNGCTAISTPTIIYAPLDTNAVLTKDLTCTGPTDATIEVTTTGGNAPYSYKVKIGAGAYGASVPFAGATFTYTATTADTYQFEITDTTNGCTKETNIITIDPIVNPDITNVVQTQFISCSGESTAAIQITIDNSKGLAPFVFNVYNTTTSFDYGTQTSGLAAGDYTITVTDAKGCTDTFPITIGEPSPIVVTAHADPITCGALGVSQGAVIIDSVTGGTAPYDYFVTSSNGYSGSESNAFGTTSSTFNTIDFGLYQVLVVDANGCSYLIQDLLVASPPNDLDININLAANCLTGGQADISVGGSLVSSGPFHFAIYTGPGMTYAPGFPWQDETFVGSKTTTFTNLIPGVTYTFIVYDESTLCYYYEIATAPVPTDSTLFVSPVVVNNITCTGSADGNVSFDVTSSYVVPTDVTYEIFDSLSFVPTGISGIGTVPASGTLSFSNLGPLPFGTFFVLVKEDVGATNAGCSVVTTSFNITESAILLSITASVSKNENCNELGVISAIGKDGTAPYEYQAVLTGNPIVPGNWASPNTFNLAGGNYDIYVRDAYGCIKSVSNLFLPTDAPPTIDPVALQCFTGTPISITLSGTTSVGPVTYSIGTGGIAGAYQASPTFSINAAGTYDVFIKDGNGCVAQDIYVVQPELVLDANMTKELDCTVSSGAEITLTAIGGTGIYSLYEFSTDSGATYNSMLANIYTASVAGTYQFRVTDDFGCQAESAIITVDPISNPTASTSKVDPSCQGDTNGSVQIIATGGVGPYTYSFNGSAFTTTSFYPGFGDGTYTYEVRDSKSCSYTDTVTLIEPTALTTTVTVTPFSCSLSNTKQSAVITIDVPTTGTPPYQYSFNGSGYSSITNTLTINDNGTNQVINYSVKDANGCTYSDSVTIFALNPPTDLDFTSTAITCNPTELTSDVTLTATNGVLPLTYAIVSPVSATGNTTGLNSGVFTGLAADTYVFRVTDDNGCYYEESYTVDPVTNITVSGALISDVTCNGASNGAVDFTVSNFATTYSYTINAGAPVLLQSGTTISLTGLPIGNQTIDVTDDTTGCTASFTVLVSEPTILTLVETSNINATCNTGAQVTVTAGGGTPGYTYAFVQDTFSPAGLYTTSNTAVLDPLTNVNWDVWVMDNQGCTTQIDVVIATDPSPTVTTPPLASNQCIVTSGFTFTATGASGVPPYVYSINGGASYQSSATFTVNVPGTYFVTIKDANGCTDISPTATVVYAPLNTVASITKELDCTISPDAEITVTISGGNGPFTYTVQKGAGAPSAPSGPIAGPTFTYPVSLANVDTYTFEITDANGCTSTSTITVDPITNPVVTATKTDVSCNTTGFDGTVQLTGSGGSGGYTYSDDNVTFTLTSLFTGLSAGPYTFYVKDSKDCTSSVSVTIAEPTALVATASATDFSCSATNTYQSALITIAIPTTGTAPYTYSFNGGATFSSSNTLTVNDNGTDQTFSYVVRDANGCSTAPQNITIVALDPPTDLAFSSAPITCTVPITTVSVVATNGVGVLTYAILSPVASATSNTTGNFAGLAPDTYVFEVTDANGCYYQESYTVDPVTNITVAGTLVNDVSCNGGSNGAVDFTVSNFAGTYSYAINGGLAMVGQSTATISLTGLPIGNQQIDVTDEITGCIATETINITEPVSALTFTAIATNVYCTNDESQITVTATGGTPNYTYAAVISGDPAPLAAAYGNSNVVTVDTNSGTDLVWEVYVKDINGCFIMNTVTVILDPEPTVTVPTGASNQCNLTGTPYSFTITGSTGVPPLTYSIGTGFQSSGTFTGLAPGNYFVTVKDGNGCTAISPTSVMIYPPLDLTPTITALPTCADNDGIITVSPSGGSGTYTYVISPSVGSLSGNVFSNVPSGTYTITITDTVTSCSKDVAVTLSAATPVTFTTSVDDVSCNGGNDGIITVNLPASNDNPIYTYEIIAGPSIVPAQNSNIFTGLLVGNYTVQVNSGRGCSATAVVPVGEPTPLTVSGTATAFGCAPDNSVNTSTLTITEVGGTSPYSYSIDGVNYLTNNIFDIIDTGVSQTINIFTKDANGCLATNTVVIAPLPTLTAATVAIATPIDCNNTGSVAISVTGGSGNFTYQMLPSGAAQASNTFSITLPGDYYFQVNDITTGCTIATSAFTVAPFDTIDVIATATTPVTCFGDTDGALEINVTGYTGTYNYEVFDSSGASVSGIVAANTTTNPQVITGLSGGNYTVAVTETGSPFCATISNMVTIASPSAALTLVANETSNVTCTNDKGTITSIASGGWGTYEYELTGTATVAYSPNGTFTNLSAGNYTINVRDAGGCIASDNVTLTIPTPINATVTPSTTLLSCFGDTSATITVSGVTDGQGSNYSYTLITILPTVSTSGPQASPVFSGLGAGTYNVVITDGYNCAFTSAPIVISEPTKVQSSLVKSTSQTCLTGTTLTLSATGGTGLYTYSDTASFATFGTFVSSTTINVAPGTYMYYVRDANGCAANVSNQIKIDPLPALVVNLSLANAIINCAGDNTGVIVATAQGGLGNYIYTLQDGSGTNIPGATQNSPGRFTQLFAGDYQVRVDSGDCSTTSALVSITEPASPLIAPYIKSDVTCNGSNNGTVEINASGGTGQIKYAISPQLNQFFVSNVFNDLAPGIYDVIAQDELGCFVMINFTITEPSPLILNVVAGSLLPEVCSGDMDGEFSIDLSGGTAPYSVSLDDYNGVYTIGTLGQTQFDFTGLRGGDHIVYVRDNLGCETEWTIAFPEAVTINPMANVDDSCINNSASNTVTVTVDASVNPVDLDYSLDGAAYVASNIFTNVAAGTNHYIDVRHTNGCIQRTSLFDIDQIDPLTLVLIDGGLNEIVAVATGGSGVYQYTVNGEFSGNSDSIIIYKSGDYVITVTDANGCEATATKYMEYIDICIPNYFTPNNDGVEDTWAPGCTLNYKNLVFLIFDRYGRKVATYRLGEKWDGKYKGVELPSGDYWYTLKLNDTKDSREFVGHFTLYR
tara:strand:+ start:15992 stop:32578 length:16587 start_codon:yes stop_codon:yes gene_type:complete